LVELVRTLSNTEAASNFDRLLAVLAPLKAKAVRHKIDLDSVRPRQGDVLGAIKTILADYPEGLQTFEIRQTVEVELGRKLPKSNVKDALASNPAFERIKYGRYRLSARS
jgi:hypothetical protein